MEGEREREEKRERTVKRDRERWHGKKLGETDWDTGREVGRGLSLVSYDTKFGDNLEFAS